MLISFVWLVYSSPNVHTFVDFHVGVACNTNASDVCEIKFTCLLTYDVDRPLTLTAAMARRVPAGFSATHMYVPSSRFSAFSIISRLRPFTLADASVTLRHFHNRYSPVFDISYISRDEHQTMKHYDICKISYICHNKFWTANYIIRVAYTCHVEDEPMNVDITFHFTVKLTLWH